MTTEDLIRQRFKEAEGLNFAACRFPDTNETWFFYSGKSPVLKRLSYVAERTPDFVFSPYSGGNQAYFLNAEAVFKNETLVEGIMPAPIRKDVITTDPVNFVADKAFYLNYVQQIRKNIIDDKLDKVVAARSEPVALPADFNASDYYIKLQQHFPSAMVYYISAEGLGCWTGASPEVLLETSSTQLRTVALAGTKPTSDMEPWGEKETDEQHMVSDFIEQVFDKQQLVFQKSAPFTLHAGLISHLCNTITAKVNEEWLDKKFHKLLMELNPTPAVCGIPQFDASFFIANHEKTERRFYSGFAGMVKSKHIHLHVNLRCLELGKTKAWLYAGAGITENSEAEKEWEETDKKMSSLRDLIG